MYMYQIRHAYHKLRALHNQHAHAATHSLPGSLLTGIIFEQIGASRSADVVFDDTFFVTGGGTGGDQAELAIGTGFTTATTASSSSYLSNGRPRSTPIALPSNQIKLAHAPGTAALGEPLSPVRRDVWTADAGCLGPSRLFFRSQPIHDLVSSTFLSIDPSGVFSMYEEWSNIKNRVLSRKPLTLSTAFCLPPSDTMFRMGIFFSVPFDSKSPAVGADSDNDLKFTL